MLSESRRLVSVLFLAILLVPCLARAQSVAESFDQLQKLLKADDVVVVINNGGTQTTGRVTEVTSNSCGYCTSGMIVAARALLSRMPNPTIDQVKQGLDGNLCRCGTHTRIIRAVLRAAKA